MNLATASYGTAADSRVTHRTNPRSTDGHSIATNSVAKLKRCHGQDVLRMVAARHLRDGTIAAPS